MVATIKESMRIHHGREKSDHRIIGRIELWVDDKYCRSRHFESKTQRKQIIDTWYRISPNLKNNYHFFIVKYDYV